MKKLLMMVFALCVCANAYAEDFTLRDAVLYQGKKGIGEVSTSIDGESYYQMRGMDKIVKV